MTISWQPLTHDQHPAAVDLLLAAFSDNIVHRVVFPDPGRRARQLRWLMTRNVAVQADVCAGFAVSERDELRAVGFWHPPNAPGMDIRHVLQYGLWRAPFALGPRAARRGRGVMAEVQQRATDTLGGEPVWMLYNFAVHPAHQGHGLGTRLLRSQLSWLRDEFPHLDAPAALVTHTERNLRLYQRLGFELLAEHQINLGAGIPMWVMRAGQRRSSPTSLSDL